MRSSNSKESTSLARLHGTLRSASLSPPRFLKKFSSLPRTDSLRLRSTASMQSFMISGPGSSVLPVELVGNTSGQRVPESIQIFHFSSSCCGRMAS